MAASIAPDGGAEFVRGSPDGQQPDPPIWSPHSPTDILGQRLPQASRPRLEFEPARLARLRSVDKRLSMRSMQPNEPAQFRRIDSPPRTRGLLGYTRRLDRALRGWRKATMMRLRRIWRRSPYGAFDIDEALQFCRRQPLYSLIVPVLGGDAKGLAACLESIERQLYSHWELIVVPVGQPSPAVAAELQRRIVRDSRIRTCESTAEQRLAAAINQAVLQATGEFVGFLEPHDELTPDALLWMVVTLNRNPRSRWLYSDEATLDHAGRFAGRSSVELALAGQRAQPDREDKLAIRREAVWVVGER